MQEHEAAAAAQRGELEALAQHVAGVEAEYGALREEYRAVTDDLAALVRENQVGTPAAAALRKQALDAPWSAFTHLDNLHECGGDRQQ